MTVNKANVDKYVSKTAHEIAKRKTKNNKIADNDPEVVNLKSEIIGHISGGGPNVKVVVSNDKDENNKCAHYYSNIRLSAMPLRFKKMGS